MPETPAPRTITLVPFGRPDRTGRGPACAAIRSHDRIALITSVDPPTNPNCSRKLRRVKGQGPLSEFVSVKGASHYKEPDWRRSRVRSVEAEDAAHQGAAVLPAHQPSRTWNWNERAKPPTCVICPKLDVPNVETGPMNSGSSKRFSTSTRSDRLLPPSRCVLEIARSVVR